MVDINMVWLIVNMVMAILLAVSTVFAFSNATVQSILSSLLFLTFEVIICVIPFVAALNPYFQFLTTGVGAPLLLLVIACFYFGSLSNFCSWGWSGCYGSVIGIIVFITCIVELFFKKDELKQVGQQAMESTKSAADQGKSKLTELKNSKAENGEALKEETHEIVE